MVVEWKEREHDAVDALAIEDEDLKIFSTIVESSNLSPSPFIILVISSTLRKKVAMLSSSCILRDSY